MSGTPKKALAQGGTIRHGLRAGKLPPDCKYVETQINKLRRQLEEAVHEVKGQVSLTDAALIQTCIKWERHGALALRWLRVQGDQLKPADKLNFSREIAKASTERDKAIKALDLDAPPPSPWAMLAVSSEEGNDG